MGKKMLLEVTWGVLRHKDTVKVERTKKGRENRKGKTEGKRKV